MRTQASVSVTVFAKNEHKLLVKIKKDPTLRNVPVDRALGRPDQAFFFWLPSLAFNSAEVDWPGGADLQRRSVLTRAEGVQGIGDFKGPPLV